MNKFKIAAIICAAGTSSRMPEQNKLLLGYQNTTFIGQVTRQIIATQAGLVIVVTGYESDKIRAALSDYDTDVTFVNNPLFRSGHTSSIQAGLKVLPKSIDAFMIVLGDMPTITTAHYDLQIDHFQNKYQSEKHLITRPMNEKIPGHPVIFSNSLKPALSSCISKDGCRSVIKDHHDFLSPYIAKEGVYFTDIDTYTDYLNLKATI